MPRSALCLLCLLCLLGCGQFLCGLASARPNAAAVPEPRGYAVVTSQAIADGCRASLDAFLAHKTSLGFACVLVTETDYASSGALPPAERPAAIKAWLQDHARELGLGWLLLIGDPRPDGDLPMPITWPRAADWWHPEQLAAPSDRYYAALAEDWDLDDDGRLGEAVPLDNSDLPAQVAQGDFGLVLDGWLRLPSDPGLVGFQVSSLGRVRLFVDDMAEPVLETTVADQPVLLERSGLELPGGFVRLRLEYAQPGPDGWLRVAESTQGEEFHLLGLGELYHDAAGATPGIAATYYDDAALQDQALLTSLTPVYLTFDFWQGDMGQGGLHNASPATQPDLAVGRIPVRGPQDYAMLAQVLARSVAYETGALFPAAQRSRTLVALPDVAIAQDDQEFGEALASEILAPAHMAVERIYPEGFAFDPPPEHSPCSVDATLDGLAHDPALVVWRSEGDAARAEQVLALADAAGLSADAPAMVLAASPGAGDPQAADSLATAMLRHGAVAVVAPSAWVWREKLETDFANSPSDAGVAWVFCRELLAGAPAGAALSRALDRLVVQEDEPANAVVFNLLGDPAQSLYPSAAPALLPVAPLSGLLLR